MSEGRPDIWRAPRGRDSSFSWSTDAAKAGDTGPISFPADYIPPVETTEPDSLPHWSPVYVDCYSGRSAKRRTPPQGSQFRKRPL